MDGQIPITHNNQPPENNLASQESAPIPDTPRSKKKLILIALAVVAILLITTLTLVLISRPKKPLNTKSLSGNSGGQNAPSQTPKTTLVPKLQFESYTLTDFAKGQPGVEIAARYSLKTDFSEADIKPISEQLGLTNFSAQSKGYLVSNTAGQNNLGFMAFDKTTGSFQIRLAKNSKGPIADQQKTVQQIALEQLKSIGVADPSVDCQITYQLKNSPGITYVECHRNWQKLTLPLIDFAGVMNMKVGELISNVKPGEVYPSTPVDLNVISVSNGGSGKARPNDFNTATVGIRQDGSIVSIDSNLRWIMDSQSIQSENLITKNQAINLAAAKKSELYLSLPSPADKSSWSEIYPENVGKAKSASVDELLLVYLEKPQQTIQPVYEPYYLIRGTAFLESGHAIKYVQALSADRSKYTEQELSSSQTLHSASSDPKQQLQLETFQPVYKEPPAPEVPNPYPQNPFCTQEEITRLGKKPLDPNQSEGASWDVPIIDIPGYGKVGILHEFTVYYIVSLTNGEPIEFTRVMAELAKHDSSVGYGNRSTGCQISTNSPTVFIYPESTIDVEIKLGPATAYTDPLAFNNTWKVVANNNGSLLINGLTKNYLYYEYDSSKTKFSKSKEGYVIKKSEINALIGKVSNKLGLTSSEQEVLLKDSIDVLSKINSEYVLVGLASLKSLNDQLPIAINPPPANLNRINLTFSPSRGDGVTEPEISRIRRSGYTVVEVGVSTSD